ncbi:MAG: nucleoside hydrolase [Chloroflexi bacterium]|nr:nucleoside hydrolase [Chloroflexota bacterium]
MPPLPILIDCDTGVDDALALLLAARSPALKILGVTCVAGNVSLDAVVPNTLTVLDAAQRPEIPVAAGYASPLVHPLTDASHVHGNDGLGLPDWPRSTRQPNARHAVDLMAEILTAASEPVTIIALAPLTNLAGFVQRYPELLPRIARIISMGGSAFSGGNMTAAAEFNIGCDPEAAAVVYNSGVPITLYGLDVFRQVTLTAAEVAALEAAGKPWSPLLGGLLRYVQRRFHQTEPGLGDGGTVTAAILPDTLTTRAHRVHIELSGTHTRGMTVVDRRVASQDARHAAPPNADVAYAIDARRCAQLFVETLR